MSASKLEEIPDEVLLDPSSDEDESDEDNEPGVQGQVEGAGFAGELAEEEATNVLNVETHLAEEVAVEEGVAAE